MADRSLDIRLKNKRDTSSNWTSKNPVLLDGEFIVVDTSTGEVRFKVGDGTKTYTQLPFTDEVFRNSVKYIDQVLTEEQKLQARMNIGASDFSGSYNDLTDKPEIPEQVQIDWNQNDSTKPDYIKNKPILPSGEVVTSISKDTIQIGDVVYNVIVKGGVPSVYENDIYADNNGTILSGYVYTASFSPDGKLLVLGGSFTGRAKLYSVDGNNLIYISNIIGSRNATLTKAVHSSSFSPDGKLLVLGGEFTGYANLYSVKDDGVTFIKYIKAGTSSLGGHVYTASFSPDGTKLVLGGALTGKAKLYSVEDNDVTYISDIYADSSNTVLSDYVRTTTFSPDGTKLVLGGNFTGKAKLYSVESTTITYINDIYANNSNTVLSDYVRTASFSPDGTKLVLGGNFTGYGKLYSIEGTTLTYVSDIYADSDNAVLDNLVYTSSFLSNGKLLVLGGEFTGKAKFYSVKDNNITYISDIYADNSNTVLNNGIYTSSFLSDEANLVLGGNFTGCAKLYTGYELNSYLSNDITKYHSSYSTGIAESEGILDEELTVRIISKFNTPISNWEQTDKTQPDYIKNKPILTKVATSANYNDLINKPILPNGEIVKSIGKDTIQIGDVVYNVKYDTGYTLAPRDKIYSNNNNTFLNNLVRTASFSPDGKLLVLGGEFTGRAKLYSVNNNSITYISDIYADNNGTILNNFVYTVLFSPDSTKLILGGQFTGCAKLYSVEDTTITYISDVYADNDDTILDDDVKSSSFSSDGTQLVLGGNFTGKAKLYSVEDNDVTYISDIYADNSNTVLSKGVSATSFSPDNTKLVLGGAFTGYGKLYSVEGNSITYISDIYEDNNSTVLSSSVLTVSFSPDGTKLVLGGGFTGKAKLYSIEGTALTYISDIYADNDNTVLGGSVYTSSFSLDGTQLVLGGYFTYKSKMYSVEGNSITYISNISGASNNYTYASAFSPDGTKLVLGGQFSRYAILYSNYYMYSYLSNDITKDYSSYSIGIAESDGTLDEELTVRIISDFNTSISADWAQIDETQLGYIKNKPELSTVATSGNYNDLINQPVENYPLKYEETPSYTWDGVASTLGEFSIPIAINNSNYTFHKISEDCPEVEFFYGCKQISKMVEYDSGYISYVFYGKNRFNVNYSTSGDAYFISGGSGRIGEIFISKQAGNHTFTIEGKTFSVSVPSTGLYVAIHKSTFYVNDPTYYISEIYKSTELGAKINSPILSSENKEFKLNIDDKGCISTENINNNAVVSMIPSPTSAEIGQTVKVSAIDETGKPTTWEAVDIPEQVQIDWNQNDSTKPDYIKNKPDISNLASEEYVEETTSILRDDILDKVSTSNVLATAVVSE